MAEQSINLVTGCFPLRDYIKIRPTVTLAKAGVQEIPEFLNSGFRRNDVGKGFMHFEMVTESQEFLKTLARRFHRNGRQKGLEHHGTGSR